jgi:hypothetical protein
MNGESIDGTPIALPHATLLNERTSMLMKTNVAKPKSAERELRLFCP